MELRNSGVSVESASEMFEVMVSDGGITSVTSGVGGVAAAIDSEAGAAGIEASSTGAAAATLSPSLSPPCGVKVLHVAVVAFLTPPQSLLDTVFAPIRGLAEEEVEDRFDREEEAIDLASIG